MRQTSDDYRDARVLVTGGAGAIGSALTTALAERGASVMVVDDLRSGQRWNVPRHQNVEFMEASILDPAAMERLRSWRPAVVFHLAAFFANQNSVDHPETDLEINGLGTLRVLELAKVVGVERFVFASSSSIYGSEPVSPITEDAISIELTTPYQITKLLGEMYCLYYGKEYGLPVVRARFFNSYGPGEVPGQYRNVIPNFVYWAMTGQPLPITGSAQATRDFTFVTDIVAGLLACGRVGAAVGEAFNLSSGVEVSIMEIASAIAQRTSTASPIVLGERRSWDTKPRVHASNAKARDILGFEPRVEIEHGLDATIAWFRENWDKIEQAAEFAPQPLPSIP